MPADRERPETAAIAAAFVLLAVALPRVLLSPIAPVVAVAAIVRNAADRRSRTLHHPARVRVRVSSAECRRRKIWYIALALALGGIQEKMRWR